MTTNNWIPCAERLPENDDSVLVWYNDNGWGYDSWGAGLASYGEGRWSFYISCGSAGTVSHWQPLPAPPPEGE